MAPLSSSFLSLPFPPPHVIYRIMTLPSLILSAFTIKCIFPGIPRLRTRPTGNSSHLGLTMIPTSVSGLHELANLFPRFQRPRWIRLPSHLLRLNIPLATDLCSHARTRFAFLVRIPVICTRIFWVKQEHTRR